MSGPFRHRVVHRFGLPDAPRNVPPISSGRTPSEDTTRKLFRQSKPFGIVERKLFSAKEKGFRISSKALLAEDTRFCAECEKSLIFRQFSRLQGDDATVIPTVYTGQHVPSSSATVNSTIIPIVVCMTLKQLPMARSALQEGRLSCQQRSLLGIWNLSP